MLKKIFHFIITAWDDEHTPIQIDVSGETEEIAMEKVRKSVPRKNYKIDGVHEVGDISSAMDDFSDHIKNLGFGLGGDGFRKPFPRREE